MTFPIGALTGLGAPAGVGGVAGLDSTAAVQSANGDAFASVLASSFDQLQAVQANADGLAAQAATGELKDVHDYMIARNEASLAVEMVVGIKNAAVSAFNDIMRMPI
ncbi:flagellar hook-basal body complex protein FliE [Blastococcus sp. TML/M2B]|uniref:flagellar hook-basal body complex protein FliE n=1 Tax=unclassified Blastococcus TaxID=2619396 RepID=UPI00190D6523|nr:MULTISPECIES: flagellar hook-basal body complex protein FliE [unclassified Blastococcus]MBN1091616.1 flagellar hook-basal body complex protein FliE [Blastococcus sp. TML/M2B]MBN1094829.1 flagellar hook-basal body complex protein FliE [Blastococcus sp. TML/C7B]